MPSAIHYESVRFRYQDQPVDILRDLSLQIETGEFTVIAGPSGEGKSTFCRTLNNIIPLFFRGDFTGKRHVAGEWLEKQTIAAMARKIGMVFQGSALFDSMTVEENIGFPLKMFSNKTPREIKERVDFVIDRVKLIDAHTKKPSEISGGMQKRVAIARAIVNNPKYLFCDEPNSGLDPKTAVVIDNLIQEITEEYNITTVVNTHDMNSVMEIGEKIIFLKEGVLAWEGTKKEIFKTDNEAIVDFVYSSELFKKVRKAQNRADKL